MFEVDGVTYSFHHMGIPTDEARLGERYSEAYKLYTSDDPCELAHIQWHRYEPGSPLHERMQTRPHLAFQVSDLDRATAGKKIILGPYEPIPNYRVAVIEDGGIGIELVQTNLSHDELWSRAGRKGALYTNDDDARMELAKGVDIVDEATIDRLEARLHEAILNGEEQILDQLLADEMLFIDQHGCVSSKAEALPEISSAHLRIKCLETASRQIRLLGSGAVVILQANLQDTCDGISPSGAFTYTHIWNRSHEGWRIISAQCTAKK